MTIYPGLSAYSVSLQLAGKAQPGDVNVNMASKSGAGATQSPAYSLELTGNNGKTTAELQRLKRSGQIECQTCQERKYQDGSDDPGVSFKAPGSGTKCAPVYRNLSGVWPHICIRRRNPNHYRGGFRTATE